MRLPILISMAVLTSMIAFPARADIVLGTSIVTSRTYDGVVATSEGYAHINPSGTVTAARPGGNYATTGYSVDSGAFDFSFAHNRVGSYQSYSESTVFLPFRPDIDVAYQLSGDYGLRAQDAGRLYLAVDLFDGTTNQLLFRQVSESRHTPGESFSLGTPSGDYSQFMSGAMNGTLLAGHQYLLSFQLLSHAFLAADSGALATGNLTLEFVQVPAPGALGLAATGFAFVAIRRRYLMRLDCRA